MSVTRFRLAVSLAALLGLAGCATRPVNPPITHVDPNAGYTFQTRQKHFKSQENLVVLAFSGGGTRAAAFSYGVLEFLRRTEVTTPKGKARMLDAVDVITGVSGGSFTALAYGLYGDKLFADYEQRFLKRNVQGELLARTINPAYWGDLSSTGWGRSELAAQLYDEILFNGATFGDLDRGDGPFIMASATDISNGGRVVFQQNIFNVLCSDLNAVRLSRAAAASSAVPVVLSAVTINNYGGTCNYAVPAWVKMFTQSANPPRPAARAIRELKEAESYTDSVRRPYIHLVDGGVSDNVGMRGVLDALQILEALHAAGLPTPLDHVRRIIVLVVNSLSSPPTDWDRIGVAARHGGHPAEGHRHADRSLFLRGGRAAERHFGAVGDGAADPEPGRVFRQQGLACLRRDTGAGRGGLRHRCVVCRASRPGGARLSESTTHVVRPAARGCRSSACRGGDDHPCVARISAAAEGCWRESRCRSTRRRRRGRRPALMFT